MPDARLAPAESFEVVEVQGETVAIPYRIYNEEPETGGSERPLTETQQVILHCLYSRHSEAAPSSFPQFSGAGVMRR
jgi:hypothetical protein